MQREMTERNIAHSPADYEIYDPTAPGAKPVVGRVIGRGLSDELNDRHYLVVDSVDGQALYIDIGRGDATEPTPEGSIIRVTPKSLEPRKVDRTVAEVAAAYGGQYTIDLHLKYDERATDTFAETHERRLEAIRKLTVGVTREPDGTWIIEPDHLARVVEYEKTLAKRTPVVVEKLSSLSLEQQITRDGATWLDRQLVSDQPEPTQDSGFGHEVRQAMKQRQQWLAHNGLAQEEQGAFSYSSDMLAVLQDRELSRVAGQIAKQSGLSYSEAFVGDRVEGTVSKIVDLASGKFAMIEKSREFSLVPWRPVLEKNIGKEVSGIMRESGISWTIGRSRGIEIGGM